MQDQIMIPTIALEAFASIVVVIIGFLIILNALKKDDIKLLKANLITANEIADNWKEFYDEFYKNDYTKLLTENRDLKIELCRLKASAIMPNKPKKKDLNTSINQMNQHSDKKIIKEEKGKLGK